MSLQEYVAEYLTVVMSAVPLDNPSVADAKIWQTAAAGFNRPNVTVRVEDTDRNGSLTGDSDRVVLTEVIESREYTAVIVIESNGASYSVAYPDPAPLP